MNLPTTQNRKNTFTKNNKNSKRFSSSFAIFFCLLALVFLSNITFSQATDPNSPCAPCASSDIKVLGAELTDINGNPLPSNCTPGSTTFTAYLKVNLIVTASERYGFL